MKEQSPHNSSSGFLKTDGGKTKSNAIEIPSISLPKGGGAIKGMDEKFSVNAVNGTSSFSLPLPFSPARGASPSISLSYSSGAGNGVFGLGWNISLSSIKRKTDKGLPQYFDEIDSDTFLFSEAEDLVPEFKKDNDGNFILIDDDYIINEKDSPDTLSKIRFYKPRIEGLFARIERWTEKFTGRIKWRVITRDNTTTLFGWTDNSIISNPKDVSKIYEWLPEFVFDDKGNCCHYLYSKEDADGFDEELLHNRNRIKNGEINYINLYLNKVLYGNKTPFKKFGNTFPIETDYMFQTNFDYGTIKEEDSFEKINNWNFRSDAFSDYKSGFEIRTTRLCKRVLLFHIFGELAVKPDKSDRKTLIKSVNFDYDTSSEQDFTFLKSITSYGYIKKADGTYSHKKLPPMEFEYQKHDWSHEVKTISSENLMHSPSGIDEQQFQFTDLFNEGLSGILTEQVNGWYYKHNLGNGKFEQAKLVSPKPSFAGLGSQLQLADLDGDGGKQLVSFSDEPRGYFELDDDNEWQSLHTFKALPNIDFGDANTRMLDLNGDGLPEVVISEDNVFTWYASEGKNGYATAKKTSKPFDEEEGSFMVFADQKQTIFLADMSGNGMTDILRIRNGEVCYWPNLGYGKFGAKVAMDNAPIFDHPDAFNPAFLRLTDIDGSGTSDIIYLGKNKFTCWKNLSGNRFGTTPFEIDVFPEIHSQSKITVTDLLGNGVACIVWSSSLPKDAQAPLKYIDLMNSKKPHIMVSYKNNLGKEVSMEYTPSTSFYIGDKLAGNPWVTKLHFPVHCVSKTSTEDTISGYKFISEYRYHHGYYDHAEREFRGFGMVEQIDAETFEHWENSGATNITDVTLHQEPIVSKSWHHTGAFLRNEKLLDQFEKDYWYKEMQRQGFEVTHQEVALTDAKLIASPGIDSSIMDNLSGQEWQEALRACKGMALRSETFAKDAIKFGNTEDARKKELTPFTVATHNCVIELLQPKGKNKHAVFVAKESEAITYSYERNAEDPRIAHSLNIKLDEYGNVLESAAVVYPRLSADISLPFETQHEQSKTIIFYAQNQFTNDIINEDAYHLRLPSEVKTYELKSVAKANTYYSIEEFTKILLDTNSDSAFYHELNKPLIAGKAQKRLIEDVRSLYYNSDLKDPLPAGQIDLPVFSYESYQLAYTPELLTDIYKDKAGEQVLEDLMILGKFAHSMDENGAQDNNWWIRSGTTQFITDTETRLYAENRFYAPISYIDPLGSISKVKYYKDYFLFIEETEDMLGNVSKVEHADPTKSGFNFRTLSPEWMKDINCNYSASISDELGLVKAVAIMGKGNEADNLTGFSDITDAAETVLINSFFNASNADKLTNIGKQLLNGATSRFVYDFEAYTNSGKPVVVAAITREQHFQKLADSPVQIGFEYSNGVGEVVMKKVQAEPGLAKQVIVNADNTITVNTINTAEQLRWIGNGRTIKNNKGNAVKQYEPYFSVNWHYEDYKELVETGVTPILYYDAAGRMIKTEMPDGTFSKVEFDSWKQTVFDANDTVLDSKWYSDRINNLLIVEAVQDAAQEKMAAQKAAAHYDTPALTHLDTLGRQICTIAHNKSKDFSSETIIEEFYTTLVLLDTESNLREVIDAAGNSVMTYKYDMLGNMLYQNSMDAGERWMLNDCMGKPVYAWDAKDQQFASAYDMLHRPVHSALIKEGNTIITSKQEYIDTKDLTNAELAALQQLNLVAAPVVQYDSAGITKLTKADFKGNPLETSRQLCKDYKSIPDWTIIDRIATEDEIFISSGEFDALNRPVKMNTPHTENGAIPASVMMPVYNEAGTLDGMNIKIRGNQIAKPFVTNINYDAKGQRESIYYSNNTVTRYTYDKNTFRLLRLLSTGNTGATIFQDLRYTYDPVGNITFIKDMAQPTVFFNGQEVKAENEYDYDTTYQLVKATGREHIGQNKVNETNTNNNNRNFPFENTSGATDMKALRNYNQHYLYDAVGNILQMQHLAADGNWSRKYWYNNNEAQRNELSIDAATLKNNQLLQTQIGGSTPTRYTHDIQGNMLNLPHLMGMVWNYKDQLAQIDLGGGGKAFYVYDGSGQRIRKVIERNGGTKEERLYLGAVEVYRETNAAGAVREQTETLHVMDDASRIAMVETKTIKDGIVLDTISLTPLLRFQYGNHLGSTSLELNESADTISYEEYHPYGTTAYQAKNASIKSAAKRYRYTGMERDEETGLEYHSARYYLPWLGRWLSADPIGIEGGINIFVYSKSNTVFFKDLNGEKPEGIVFDKDSKISAQKIYEDIQASKTLTSVMKGFFVLDKSKGVLLIKKNTLIKDKRTGESAKIKIWRDSEDVFHYDTYDNTDKLLPDWFWEVLVAVNSGEWRFTTSTYNYSLEYHSQDIQIKGGATIHTSGKKEGLWEHPKLIPTTEGLTFGQTYLSDTGLSSKGVRGGVVTLVTDYTFDDSVFVEYKYLLQYLALGKNDDNFKTKKKTVADRMKIKFEERSANLTDIDFVEIFFHELGTHAALNTFGRPSNHGNSDVEDRAIEIKGFFHPPPPEIPRDFGGTSR